MDLLELYKLVGMGCSLLFFMYLGILVILWYFKYETVLKRIFILRHLDEFGWFLFVIYFMAAALVLLLDFLIPKPCLSAVLNSVVIGCAILGWALCLIVERLMKIRSNLPRR